MPEKIAEIYYIVFGGAALTGTILGLIYRIWPLAIFCLIGLAVIGFWYYLMKVGE